MKIPIDKIIIGPRQRIDLGDPLTELESIGDPEVGLINPISVERQLDGNYLLLAGMRRLTKAKALKWTEIEATERTGLDEVQRQKIEYIEDIERKDRSWQERALATYRMFHLMRRERAREGKGAGRMAAWTVRAMASFTGYDKTMVGYMLQIGEALDRRKEDGTTHADEEMWAAESYTKGVQILSGRTENVVRAEMERRQAIARATQQAVLPISTIEDGLTPRTIIVEGDAALPGHVPEQDTTQANPLIYIHGVPKAYANSEINEASAACILGFNIKPDATDNIIKQLRSEGVAVLWSSYLSENSGQLLAYTHLVWNLIDFKPEGEHWPFVMNWIKGVAYAHNAPGKLHSPSGSVISACIYGDMLPMPVLDFSITPLTTDGMAVHCIGDIDPVMIAQLGRVPIFYDGDPTSFAEKVRRLTEHYEQTVPGCIVKVRA